MHCIAMHTIVYGVAFSPILPVCRRVQLPLDGRVQREVDSFPQGSMLRSTVKYICDLSHFNKLTEGCVV